MIQKLKKLISLFLRWFKPKSKQKNVIPKEVNIDERIARSVFSTINIDRKKGQLNDNAFRSPAGKDEVSVNRLDYTDPHFCKETAKKSENPSANRNYFGLAVLIQDEIQSLKCETIYSPILQPKNSINLFHADIKVDYVAEKGIPLPSEISYKIKNLAKRARLYEDFSPLERHWGGVKELI